jgi:hypothetical protein
LEGGVPSASGDRELTKEQEIEMMERDMQKSETEAAAIAARENAD